MENHIMIITSDSMLKRRYLLAFVLCVSLPLVLIMTGLAVGADEGKMNVVITTNFPGGNALVQKNEGNTVQVAPDLRGDKPWFYWYFQAEVKQPGRVNFVFPEKVIGFKNGAIGKQGPAVSLDLGKTWEWMGTDNVEGKSFYYNFTEKNQKVRFAVTIPYLQSDLDAFLKKNSANPHLAKSVLTKSRKGREVELLQIGKPGPGVKAVLLTCRHHASETMASYVHEGFMKAAMSDTPEGIEFRKEYVLYAVPFVDKDGVEDGDQGKNRKPHDHNRDYGEGSIYPEVDAIEKLGDSKNVHLSLDLHCPTLVMGDHQVMYFAGHKNIPKNNYANVKQLADLIDKELPPNAPHGPLVWLRDAQGSKGSNLNSGYFARRKGAIMAVTLEIPFAPPGKNMAPDTVRKYGELMLAAWVKTEFLAADAEE